MLLSGINANRLLTKSYIDVNPEHEGNLTLFSYVLLDTFKDIKISCEKTWYLFWREGLSRKWTIIEISRV